MAKHSSLIICSKWTALNGTDVLCVQVIVPPIYGKAVFDQESFIGFSCFKVMLAKVVNKANPGGNNIGASRYHTAPLEGRDSLSTQMIAELVASMKLVAMTLRTIDDGARKGLHIGCMFLTNMT
jgi:hypothetical protein